MLPFAQTIDAAFDALDAFRGRLSEADPSAPTRLPGWDVDGLARHVAAAAWQQGEAFHRARVGATHAPSYLEIGPDQIERAAAHLRSGIDEIDAASDLRAPVADAVVDLMGAMLPGLASSGPDRPASFALRTPDATTHIAWRDGAWQTGGEIEPDCTIEGSSSDVALFALGRKPASELDVRGETALAGAFKDFFPGP